MKKWIALFLSVLMIASVTVFAACDDAAKETETTTDQSTKPAQETEPETLPETVDTLNGLTPYQAYVNAGDSFPAMMDNCRANVKVSMISSDGTHTGTETMTVTVDRNGENMSAKSESKSILVFKKYNFEVTLADGVLYYTDGDKNVKQETDVQAEIQKLLGVGARDTLMSVDETCFREAGFEKQSDGTYVIRLKSEKDFVDPLIEPLLEKIDVKSVEYAIVFAADGSVTGYTMTYESGLTGNAVTYVCSFSFSEIGTVPEIATPSDAESYLPGQI